MKNTFLLRFALRALGETIWSSDLWWSEGDLLAPLDPIVTVHPDRIFFEAFSQDQSVYASVIVDPALFATEGEVRTGTTNVDFTAWLWAALNELRSSRETWFHVGAEGFEVKTKGSGGRFQQKVDLPEPWVRGFLQLQGAMAMPGTRLSVRPVDLLAAIRFLRYTKAKLSPRALRYEFDPGQEARIVLEPWEHVVPLRGTEHNYTEPRRIRTWGRRRLKLIEGLLPFAERVDIYLKGRALPSFYAVKMPGITFVLGLSGWTSQRWTDTASFDLLSGIGDGGESVLPAVLEQLASRHVATVHDLAETLRQPRDQVAHALERLCRLGRAIYDAEARAFRHRELFEQPIDEAKLYPPDARRERAQAILSRNEVRVGYCEPQETRKLRKLPSPEGKVQREIIYRDWRIVGSVAGVSTVEIVVNDLNRIIFGTCGCECFRENLLNKGPCEHMLALFAASQQRRQDLPTSVAAAEGAGPVRPHRSPATGEMVGPETESDVDTDEETEEKDGR